MKKRIVSVFLVLVTLLAIGAVGVSAEDAWAAKIWIGSYNPDPELAYDESFFIDASNHENAEGKNIMQFFQYVYGAICEWDDAKGAFVITKSDKWNPKVDWVVPKNGFFFMVGVQGQPELSTNAFGEANYDAVQAFVDNAAAGQTIYFYGVDFANKKIDATPWTRTDMSKYSTKAYATIGAPDTAAGEAATLTTSSIGHSSMSFPEASTDDTDATTASTAALKTDSTKAVTSTDLAKETEPTTATTAASENSDTSRTTTSTTRNVAGDVIKPTDKTGDDNNADNKPNSPWPYIGIFAAVVVIIAVVVVVVVKKKKSAVDTAVNASKKDDNK